MTRSPPGVRPALDPAGPRTGRREADAVRRAARRATLLFAVALLVVAVLYVAAIDEVAGLYVDDAWYLVLARALATGHGFTLDNAPADGVLPFYPPGFPALLALVLLVTPDFPANVWLLKLASVAAVLGAACLLRVYFLRLRGTSPTVASGLALLAAAAPGLHFLVTGAVMAEGVFVLAQVAAVLLVERVAGTDARVDETVRGVAAGVLVAATVLVRTMGVGLVPAAIAYLLLRRRLRGAVVVALTSGAILGAWQAYVTLHTPTPEQQALVNDAIAWPYGEHFWMRHAGHAELGTATVRDLPARVADQLLALATRTLGSTYAQPVVDRLRPRGRGPWLPGVALSVLATALTLVGFAATVRTRTSVADLYVAASLALLALWPFPVGRHLVPLLPFLAVYLVAGCGRAAQALGGSPRAAERARVACVVLLVAVNASGLVRDVLETRGLASGVRSAWRSAYHENLSVLAWVRANLPRSAVLASHNPAMVHLFTGNRTMGAWRDATDAASWRAGGARFWVDNTIARYRHPDMAARGLTPLFRTRRRGLGVYRLPPGGAGVMPGAGTRTAPAGRSSPSG